MLYIVGTPIGNLEDITYRALKVLAEVDYILAKDMKILPIEVKAEVKGGMKSLYSFVEAKGITHAVRTSLENFGRFTKGDCVIDIYPLYALQNLVGT